MRFDVFFSVSQTPVDGILPDESTMLRHFLDEVIAADELGFDVAWVAEAHHSTQVQKTHAKPVVPHWQGEIGLNTDITQLAARVFDRTQRIEVGSAISNILCNGGPIAAAERVATFAAWHGLDPSESRRLHFGFSGGRFEFMNRPFGIRPRDAIEQAAWPALKGLVFWEAAEIFVRLLQGEVLSSHDIRQPVLTRADFRTDDDWARVQAAAGGSPTEITVAGRYDFEAVEIVPRAWRRELVQLIAGTHDPRVQQDLNRFAPVQVFNLSITAPDKIEATHARLAAAYHADGGPWQRHYMPRTTFVFLDADPGSSPEQQRERAHAKARRALGAYWTALEGTIDPAKVEKAAANALIGNPEDIVTQAKERFHPEDRLMLWFDFFEHDPATVIGDMEAFMTQCAPHLRGDA